jgi:dienelactone hydrolase
MTVTTTSGYTSNGNSVPLEIFAPPSSAKPPVVLLFHGSSGLGRKYRPDIVSFGEALKAAGLAAVLPHYFASAAVPSELESDEQGLLLVRSHYATWRTACADALAFVAADARFDALRIGFVGFSLGGHYALDVAMTPPPGASIKAVVEFFAPTRNPALAGPWVRMPPLLVHHGAADRTVFPSETTHLETELTRAGKTRDVDFWVKEYAGQGHGFTGDALASSRAATVAFLAARL